MKNQRVTKVIILFYSALLGHRCRIYLLNHCLHQAYARLTWSAVEQKLTPIEKIGLILNQMNS